MGKVSSRKNQKYDLGSTNRKLVAKLIDNATHRMWKIWKIHENKLRKQGRSIKERYWGKSFNDLLGMPVDTWAKCMLNHPKFDPRPVDEGGSTMDHIVPLAAFDYNVDDDIHMAFHWVNIQPLSASQNQGKCDVYLGRDFIKYMNNFDHVREKSKLMSKSEWCIKRMTELQKQLGLCDAIN
jgi:hypothetical protein